MNIMTKEYSEAQQGLVDYINKIENDIKIAERYANPVNTTTTSHPFIVGRDDMFIKSMDVHSGKVETTLLPWEAMKFTRGDATDVALNVRNGNGHFNVATVKTESALLIRRYTSIIETLREFLPANQTERKQA